MSDLTENQKRKIGVLLKQGYKEVQNGLNPNVLILKKDNENNRVTVRRSGAVATV